MGQPVVEIRDTIDTIDESILKLLAERRNAVRKVSAAKRADGAPMRSEVREVEVLNRLVTEGRRIGLASQVVTDVFGTIMQDSLDIQRSADLEAGRSEPAPAELKVAFQGGQAAYSELAAERFFASWNSASSFHGYSTFAEVIARVEDSSSDYGLLPIENTTAGSIHEVQDLLMNARLHVVGETVLQVDHCLIGLEGATPDGISTVISHPQALAQCSYYLAGLNNVRCEAYEDTALAVRKVRDSGKLDHAALASEAAARHYDLKILARGINNVADNFTRFLIVAREPSVPGKGVPAKTALFLATVHRAGALLEALSVLHRHEINLTKLESRPHLGSPFEYIFYLELEGKQTEERVDQALFELRSTSRFLKVMGSFPAFDPERPSPSPSVLAPVQAEAEKPAAAAGPEADAKDPLARRHGRPDTIVRVGRTQFGGDGFVWIAGPCAVESEEQIFECARIVREFGGKVLRGGCFKPRTSPYSFQGLGFEGVELLAAAGRETGLATVTEVLSPAHVGPVAERVDAIQIGARNMQNFSLLNEAGRVDRPVILKRGLSASLDEFLSAAEYILAAGNHRVILCERGIRTFETSTRNTLDLGAVALLRKWTHLPIIVDPSHAAGRRELVAPLAIAAHAVGPHGLMVEIHPRPEEALSDGPQALYPEDFAALVGEISRNTAGRM